MSVRIVLLISGALSLLAMGYSEAVALGLFMLIIPGLLLAMAPTVFLYTLTFAGVRLLLVWRGASAATACAVLISVGLGVVAALLMASAGRRAFDAALTGDVIPPSRLSIAGDILVNYSDTPTQNIAGKPRVPCEAFCAALLDTLSVRSVTIAGIDQWGKPVEPATYRLLPKHEAPHNELTLRNPHYILDSFPEVSKRGEGYGSDNYKARSAAVEAYWALRLAGEVTLSLGAVPEQFDQTIAIRSPEVQGFHSIETDQFDLRDRDGRILLRRQRVTARPVSVPLRLTPFHARNMGAHMGFISGWDWARSTL
jgi:hypothetical protein